MRRGGMEKKFAPQFGRNVLLHSHPSIARRMRPLHAIDRDRTTDLIQRQIAAHLDRPPRSSSRP
jgi:hypothetical protein